MARDGMRGCVDCLNAETTGPNVAQKVQPSDHVFYGSLTAMREAKACHQY